MVDGGACAVGDEMKLRRSRVVTLRGRPPADARLGRRRCRRVALISVVALLLMLVVGAGAVSADELGWPGPYSLDHTGGSVAGEIEMAVACPSATECVSVDIAGGEVTFDPASPLPTSTPAAVDPGPTDLATGYEPEYPTAIACPTTTQCTLVDGRGDEVTFDPQSAVPSTSVYSIDGGQGLTDIACPTATQCTAVGDSGNETTFDPESSAPPVAGQRLDGAYALTGVACPTAAQCTAVDGTGHELTFDPQSGAIPITSALVENNDYLSDVACPTASQCTTVDRSGAEETFDPQSSSPSVAQQQLGEDIALYKVACASTTQCTTFINGGAVTTFDPTTPATNFSFYETNPVGANGIACSTSTECSTVGADGNEATFSPVDVTATVKVDQIDGGIPLDGAACPTTTQCTTVDQAGDELTYDPLTRSTIGNPHELFPGNWPHVDQAVTAVACPSTTQCTAVNEEDEVTFDPTSNTPSSDEHKVDDGMEEFDTGDYLFAISCPTTNQCTAVDQYGAETTFDPTSANPADEPQMLVNQYSTTFTAFACATATACTVMTGAGHEMTFNPQANGSISTDRPVETVAISGGIACVSTTDCTEVDLAGNEVTFDPTQSTGTPTEYAVDPGQELTGVSCPTAADCIAVDSGGDTIAFNPVTPLPALPRTTVPGAAALEGITCISVAECVAVDSLGHGFTAQPNAAPTLTVQAPGTTIAGAVPGVTAALANGSSPSGSVSFTVYGPQASPPAQCASGGTVVATAGVTGNGTLSPTTVAPFSQPGTYWWYAHYSGDGENASADSACGAAMPDTVVTATTTTVGPPVTSGSTGTTSQTSGTDATAPSTPSTQVTPSAASTKAAANGSITHAVYARIVSATSHGREVRVVISCPAPGTDRCTGEITLTDARAAHPIAPTQRRYHLSGGSHTLISILLGRRVISHARLGRLRMSLSVTGVGPRAAQKIIKLRV